MDGSKNPLVFPKQGAVSVSFFFLRSVICVAKLSCGWPCLFFCFLAAYCLGLRAILFLLCSVLSWSCHCLFFLLPIFFFLSFLFFTRIFICFFALLFLLTFLLSLSLFSFLVPFAVSTRIPLFLKDLPALFLILRSESSRSSLSLSLSLSSVFLFLLIFLSPNPHSITRHSFASFPSL